MKTTMKHGWMVWTAGLLSLSVSAAEPAELKELNEKFSYGIGLSIGGNLERLGITLSDADLQLILRGIQDKAAGQPQLSEEEVNAAMRDFQQQAWTNLAAKNQEAGAAFLAKNKTREGVVTLPSGLQYEVLEAGSGESPQASDRVSVDYRGTLIDGTEFDSSYKRGKPAQFSVGGVIKGWTEALQLMEPGAKWKVYIPSELAYGERGSRPAIGPNATLVFEVNLLEVLPQVSATPPKPQAVTSDIIKVPSREEMEKGAKVEIIKASELEKYKEEQKAKENPDKDK